MIPDLGKKGPGTYLKEMFSWFFINATEDCPCNLHAAQMDEWGPDGCLDHLDEIVGWLRDEATVRNLPFSEMVAKRLVKICICRARKQK